MDYTKIVELLEKHITAIEIAGGELYLSYQCPPAKIVSKPGCLYEESRKPLYCQNLLQENC